MMLARPTPCKSSVVAIQMCLIVPGPETSMIVAVLWAGTLIKGRTFHPFPRSDAARENAKSGLDGSGVRIAPLALSPVGFSGETMRESTSGVRIASDATPPLSVELAVWAFAGGPTQSRQTERAVIGNKAIRRGKVRSITPTRESSVQFVFGGASSLGC